MAIQFPSNPQINDTTEQAGIIYLWNGDSWEVVPKAITFEDVGGDTVFLNHGAEIINDPVSGLVLNGPDVVVTGDLYVTGDAYISPDSLYVGNTHLFDDPISGLVVSGQGLVVSGGQITVDNKSLSSTISEFTHDGSLFPSDIKEITQALEFSHSDNTIDELSATGHFISGLFGEAFADEVRLTITSRTGGSASTTNQGLIYLKGDSASIQANPLPGYSFDTWSGSNTADITDPSLSTTTVLMDKDQYITAYFKKN